MSQSLPDVFPVPKIRWMQIKDLPDVLQIERQRVDGGWTADDFRRILRERNCIGMVTHRAGRVVGFMVYEMGKSRIRIRNLGVHVDFRRSCIARRMVEKLIAKLRTARRNRLACEVHERNLPTQVFFRSLGFLAVSILRNSDDESQSDRYRMEYKQGSPPPILRREQLPQNR